MFFRMFRVILSLMQEIWNWLPFHVSQDSLQFLYLYIQFLYISFSWMFCTIEIAMVVWNSTLCSHTINMSNNISIANNITNIMRGFTAGFMNITHSECNVFIYCLHSWLNKRHRTRMLSSLKREIESAKGHQRYFYKKYWVKLLTTKRK